MIHKPSLFLRCWTILTYVDSQIPVVLQSENSKPQARVHYLGPRCFDAGPACIERLEDKSDFVCVILLTAVPTNGEANSLLRRGGGVVEKLSFPAGTAGYAYVLHRSQIEHCMLPRIDFNAVALSIPIFPAIGWVRDPPHEGEMFDMNLEED